MTIAADTHIILGADEPKKAAVIGQGAPTIVGREMAIWGNTLVDPGFTTQTIATLWALYSVALAEAKDTDLEFVISARIDAAENTFAFAAPGAGEIGFYVGPGLTTGNRSHFIHRTLKRLCERWLEIAKSGVGLAPG